MKKLRKYVNRIGISNLAMIIALLMTPVSLSRETYDSGGSILGSGNLVRVIFAGIALGIAFLKWKNGYVLYKPSAASVFFGIYWIFGIVSLLNTNWFSYSLFKIIEYGVLISTIIILLKIQNKRKDNIFKDAFEIALLFSKIMLVIVVFGFILSPTKALHVPGNDYSSLNDAILPFQLQGWIIPLSNTAVCFYACFNMVGAFIDYFENNKHKVRSILCCLAYLFVAIVSLSRMALLASVVAIVFYVYVLNDNKKIKIIISVIALVFVLFLGGLILAFLLRGQSEEEIISVTGRTKWWIYAINVFNDGSFAEKVFGFGFAAGEKKVARESSALMYTLDSDFFANLISCGIAGFSAILLVIISSIIQISRAVLYCKRNCRFQEDRITLAKCSCIMIIVMLRLFTVTTFSLLTFYLIIFIFASNAINVLMKRVK